MQLQYLYVNLILGLLSGCQGSFCVSSYRALWIVRNRSLSCRTDWILCKVFRIKLVFVSRPRQTLGTCKGSEFGQWRGLRRRLCFDNHLMYHAEFLWRVACADSLFKYSAEHFLLRLLCLSVLDGEHWIRINGSDKVILSRCSRMAVRGAQEQTVGRKWERGSDCVGKEPWNPLWELTTRRGLWAWKPGTSVVMLKWGAGLMRRRNQKWSEAFGIQVCDFVILMMSFHLQVSQGFC